MDNKSKVYVLIDEDNRITRCEGGYTISNIEDFAEWICIDEGIGDKYNLCQTCYFDGGLLTEDGIFRYKWTGEKCILRSEDELLKDRAPMGKTAQISRLKNELAAYDYIGVKIATGVASIAEYTTQIAYAEELRQRIRALES